MPPKLKLHASNKKGPPLQSKAGTSSASSPPINPEVAQQFEIELYWCIQQLQKVLSSGKLNEKQVQDNTKILNILMNNSTSMIKKRQAMWQAFGDYRAKMTEEETKFSRAKHLKVLPASPNIKSVFVKKAYTVGTDNSLLTEKQDLGKDLLTGLDKVSLDKETMNTNKILGASPSDNSFRFNFTASE